jgi:hypothetical protein
VSETFDDKLQKIQQYEQTVLDSCKLFLHDGAPMMVMDFTLVAAAKRTLSLASGFRTHMKDRNFTCAAALLRLQLDTCLRLFAGSLSSAGPGKYFQDMFDGKPVDRMKDIHGQRLTDSYLAKRLNEKYPWVESVYKNLCDFVHLSNRHIFTTMSGLNDAERTVHLSITASDPKRSDADYFESLEAFLSCMKVTVVLIRSWHKAKVSPKAA